MRAPKHAHSDRDRIYTPRAVAVQLIKKIPAAVGDSWCDPCLGHGAFYDNFPTDNKEFFEIDVGKDFLRCFKRYDWVVTNIPFSKPKEFIFKMAECSIKGFGVLCLANSMTATRLVKLKNQGFHVSNLTTLYIKEWGFGYRTDFYVFTRVQNQDFATIIHKEKEQPNKILIKP